VIAITRRILQQFRHDRRTLALLFVAPILILGLFYFLLRGTGTSPALGVVNEDQGPFGTLVARQLLRSSEVRASELDRRMAENRLRDGQLAGYVLLPSDFSARAVRRT